MLGWATWREIETRHGLGLITDALENAIAAGALPPRPVGVLAQLVLSAAIETALLIANSADPAGTRAESESVLGAWFAGLLAQNNGPLA